MILEGVKYHHPSNSYPLLVMLSSYMVLGLISIPSHARRPVFTRLESVSVHDSSRYVDDDLFLKWLNRFTYMRGRVI